MADAYVKLLDEVLRQSAPVLKSTADIDVRHFFSGAAAYADGRIFMSLTPAGLAVKVSEDDRAALAELGAQPLQYFPKAPIKKDYLVLPDTIAKDQTALANWIDKSVAYVLTLPKPRPKSGGR